MCAAEFDTSRLIAACEEADSADVSQDSIIGCALSDVPLYVLMMLTATTHRIQFPPLSFEPIHVQQSFF